jgi:hypothetical protein
MLSLLKSAGSKISSAAKTVGSKVSSAAKTVGSKVSSVAKTVGSKVSGQSAAQAIASISNPAAAISSAKKAAEDAAGAAAISAAARQSGLTVAQQTAAQSLTKGLGGATSTLSTVSSFFTNTKLWFVGFFAAFYAGLKMTPGTSSAVIIISWLVVIIPCVILLGWAAYNYWKQTRPVDTASAANALSVQTSGAPKATKEGFATDAVALSPDDYTLNNIQPLTIKQAGFTAPISQGKFDETDSIVNALRAGFRSFIFQVDYLDAAKDPKLFAVPNVPTLLYRGDDGSLLSGNSGDIQKVAQTLANAAFTSQMPNNTEPLIIYIHVLRAPSSARDPGAYKQFLSNIAVALNPLAPNHLGVTPLGIFHRQKNESTLLTSPLKTFGGKVIILSNANTDVFRSSKTDINPASDLDFWVNMRVYLNNSADKMGITEAAPSGTNPSAVIVKAESLLALSDDKTDTFALAGRSRFVIAMPSQMNNPVVKDVDTLVNRLGVNMMPLDIFSDSIDNVKALVAEYNNMPFHPKSPGLINKSSK